MKSEQQVVSPVESDNQLSDVASKRRRFVRRGVIGAPVLLALKSAPVLACNCKQPSGFSVSGNASQAAKGQTCSPASKPILISNSEPLRSKLFAKGGAGLTLPTVLPYGKTAANYTLGDALSGATTDAALIAAAYIDATYGHFSPGVANTTVSKMWNDTVTGTYAPTPGVTWTRTDVINYLKYVMAI